MSKKQCCLTCKTHWDRERLCEICRWEDEDNPSVFYNITRSPETLVEHLVYWEQNPPNSGWTSNFIRCRTYRTKPEAVAATLKELNKPSNKEQSK